MFRKVTNRGCPYDENIELNCAIPSEKEVVSISIDKAIASTSSKSPRNIAKGSRVRTYAPEYSNGFHDSINERKCPDCGLNWNPIIQQITDLQLDILYLSPPPLVPPKQVPSQKNYNEHTPLHLLNENFNDSTSDYEPNSEFGSSDDPHTFEESRSELDRSYESLPPVNLSFTDDM